MHSFKGRSDLEISLGDVDVIAEFKYVDTSKGIRTALDKAQNQVLTREYGQRLSHRERLRIAVVYCEEERKVTLAAVD